MKNQNFKVFIASLGILLTLGFIEGLWMIQKNGLNDHNGFSLLKIEPVIAQEIYPLFICSCCGKTIDAECCGMAKQQKAYVDKLIENKNLSKDEVIISYVKEYGLNSFKDKERMEEFREKLVKEAPANRPIISLTPDSYDFGDVSQKKGDVTTFFELQNKGKTDLVINKLKTSCGCTSAAIVYQGREGPKFNMPGHGVNEKIDKNWKVVIPSGENAKLKVYYNPNMHKKFRGTATREISIFSNDPIYFEKKVKIELNQVD